jgi:SAM-dependent methyltransferase
MDTIDDASTLSVWSDQVNGLLTHQLCPGALELGAIEARLRRTPHLTLPLHETLDLLYQMAEFNLGRFLLTHRGLNAYWTSYVVKKGLGQEHLHPLENWLLNKAPAALATQERFRIFKQQLQRRLGHGKVLASLPCGLMDDLLSLNYNGYKNVRLVGVDLDPIALDLCKMNVPDALRACTSWLQRDVLHLDVQAQWDVLVSNGLNIFQPDDEVVVAYYKAFYRALKPQGVLITSFLTPPPRLCATSVWRPHSEQDVLKQQAILTDIAQVKWRIFRTESQKKAQLQEAGFRILDVIYDAQGLFPVVVAQKPA